MIFLFAFTCIPAVLLHILFSIETIKQQKFIVVRVPTAVEHYKEGKMAIEIAFLQLCGFNFF